MFDLNEGVKNGKYGISQVWTEYSFQYTGKINDADFRRNELLSFVNNKLCH